MGAKLLKCWSVAGVSSLRWRAMCDSTGGGNCSKWRHLTFQCSCPMQTSVTETPIPWDFAGLRPQGLRFSEVASVTALGLRPLALVTSQPSGTLWTFTTCRSSSLAPFTNFLIFLLGLYFYCPASCPDHSRTVKTNVRCWWLLEG